MQHGSYPFDFGSGSARLHQLGLLPILEPSFIYVVANCALVFSHHSHNMRAWHACFENVSALASPALMLQRVA